MEEKEILYKKDLIDKYFNKLKYQKIADIFIYNVENLSLYIRLDYIKKNATYRVSWVNITAMNSKDVKYWVNTNLVYPSKVENFKNILLDNIDASDLIDDDEINSMVTINTYLGILPKTYMFKRYIPSSHEFLADALFIIFDNMPKYMYSMFQIFIEKLVNPEINSLFAFDINKDNFDDLFDINTIKLGKKYLTDNKIMFIESENNITYAVVRDESDHLVSINYDDTKKEVEMSCTCENNHFCKHMYATLLAKKEGINKKFYKISFVDENMSMVENLKNFNYLLCSGIIDDYLIVVDINKFAFLPILDNGKMRFKIIEDDDKHTFEKTINKYMEDKN